jgi:hypothetical protein
LISLVQDFSPSEFKNNVLAVAACGRYFKLPTILTTSFESGPNGPLVPELKELMNWFGMACELHRDWRNDVEGLGTLFSNHIPNYRNLMTSYFTKN